jgi:lipid-A-disaccharide synthase
VLVDYPGFNWWIARRAKARGIPVFYFVPPQIWAWAGWRVSKVRRDVDQVLCSLPFEPAWYHARGVSQSVYVGHPYFDELTDRPLDGNFVAEQRALPGALVAILPGSRDQEIRRNLRHQAMAEQILADSVAREGPIPGAGISVYAARTAELIRVAHVAWAVSGSVGLELMFEALPSVVIYKVNRFDLWIARPFIKAKYISLVNLLADRAVFPEYLTSADVSNDLARWALTWLDDPVARAQTIESLTSLRDRVARPGASDRAAERISSWLSESARGSGSSRRDQPETTASSAGSALSARFSSFIRR